VILSSALGTALDPSNLSKRYLRPALKRAGSDGVTGFHSLRHTALTAAAATGLLPVQALAGHPSVAIAERYVQLATSMFPGGADLTEARLSGREAT
jgi:integrase